MSKKLKLNSETTVYFNLEITGKVVIGTINPNGHVTLENQYGDTTEYDTIQEFIDGDEFRLYTFLKSGNLSEIACSNKLSGEYEKTLADYLVEEEIEDNVDKETINITEESVKNESISKDIAVNTAWDANERKAETVIPEEHYDKQGEVFKQALEEIVGDGITVKIKGDEPKIIKGNHFVSCKDIEENISDTIIFKKRSG